MGSYVDQLRAERWLEENKEDFELKTLSVKKILGIPYLWVKQSKYEKKYLLFNKIPAFTITTYYQGDTIDA